ncbi:MAG: hypothetical protein MRJ65_08210 [Candidatus Brocadiaceae bacterium]|nr:hypothetical protein [Candidatus Brocadiaceae bacterium]
MPSPTPTLTPTPTVTPTPTPAATPTPIIVPSPTPTLTPTPNGYADADPNGDTSPNLQAYYEFNEGSGIDATDSSGNGNNGVINGATWSTGQNGAGLDWRRNR